ncbi:MAG: intracellular septation protein [Patescibacteria group bacterium]|nr:intracellular septation protein [Patescibacteria group bacterium]
MYLRLIVNTLCEFVPIVTFVLVSEYIGFIQAVFALVVATVVATAVSWYTEKHIPRFGITAAVSILIFGALTLIFNNPFFIIIKDTIYYAGFGIALLLGFYLKRSVFKFFFNDFFAMTEKGWRILETRWAIFFILLAVANEFSRQIFPPEAWVEYKLGIVIITWVFGFYQLTLSKRERLPGASELGLRIKE